MDGRRESAPPPFWRRPEGPSAWNIWAHLRFVASCGAALAQKPQESALTLLRRLVSRLRALITRYFVHLPLGPPLSLGQSLTGVPCAVPRCHKARDMDGAQSVFELGMPTPYQAFQVPQLPSYSGQLPVSCSPPMAGDGGQVHPGAPSLLPSHRVFALSLLPR